MLWRSFYFNVLFLISASCGGGYYARVWPLTRRVLSSKFGGSSIGSWEQNGVCFYWEQFKFVVVVSLVGSPGWRLGG